MSFYHSDKEISTGSRDLSRNLFTITPRDHGKLTLERNFASKLLIPLGSDDRIPNVQHFSSSWRHTFYYLLLLYIDTWREMNAEKPRATRVLGPPVVGLEMYSISSRRFFFLVFNDLLKCRGYKQSTVPSLYLVGFETRAQRSGRFARLCCAIILTCFLLSAWLLLCSATGAQDSCYSGCYFIIPFRKV